MSHAIVQGTATIRLAFLRPIWSIKGPLNSVPIRTDPMVITENK